MVDFTELAQHLIDGHADDVARLTQQAVDEGFGPAEILDRGLIAGMTVVGIRFRDNIIFVPEVLISARAMKAGMAILEPILTACGIPPVGKVIMGTVKGDIHDIGKNLVGMMLKGAGFQVHDLGVNVNLAKFQAAIEQHQPDLVGMSALLTTTMGQMKVNVEAFDKAGLFKQLRVMVGGAPVSEEYAKATGAHGYGKDASTAVQLALKLMSELKGNNQPLLNGDQR
jgi:5-methyltetrahydrofolate--homocysteine methyltransferase